MLVCSKNESVMYRFTYIKQEHIPNSVKNIAEETLLLYSKACFFVDHIFLEIDTYF